MYIQLIVVSGSNFVTSQVSMVFVQARKEGSSLPYEGVQLAWYVMRLWHPSLASHTDDFGRDGYMFQDSLSFLSLLKLPLLE